eukprot:83025-Chlamydomonas_euryale.AAC.1
MSKPEMDARVATHGLVSRLCLQGKTGGRSGRRYVWEEVGLGGGRSGRRYVWEEVGIHMHKGEEVGPQNVSTAQPSPVGGMVRLSGLYSIGLIHTFSNGSSGSAGSAIACSW